MTNVARAPSTAIRVVIADDDPDVAAAVRDVLGANPSFAVRAVTRTGDEAVVLAREADVVLMDVRMPGGGAAGVAAIRAASPRTVVVAMSAHADATTIADLLRAGAVGFVAKGQSYADLPTVLCGCARGAVTIAARTGAEALRLLAGG